MIIPSFLKSFMSSIPYIKGLNEVNKMKNVSEDLSHNRIRH